ncbi:FecR family protein [Solitalea lacus]|uniref:FecR family protein n=1 Tax=Solitalea lacus TaxID=2911172 RepID=UPI001EDA1C1D|nr:FecR family protein [Solitalea lacus]UKJ06782.1 DUF4974 domain-containing protein [Solitalea lacus]
MSNFRFVYLFQQYINHNCTAQELQEFMDLVNKSKNDDQLKALMDELWEKVPAGKTLNSVTGERILNEIFASDTGVVSLQRRSLSVWYKVAASFAALAFLLGVLYYSFLGEKNQQRQQIVQKNDVAPGGNKAVLTLADGKQLILDSAVNGALAKQGNANVLKLKNGEIAYNSGSSADKEVMYNTLATPAGGQYKLILPDGSKVWLNAASSIRYPTAFAGKERNVEISGEAYFEVAKNAEMPFKVKIDGDTEVEVLGTHFDIMAYKNELKSATTLLEGSVRIKRGNNHQLLVPGQQAVYQRGVNNAVEVEKADLESVMAWKNGLFVFDNVNIEQVMRQIERWYDVEVVYKGKVPDISFTGVIPRNSNVSKVLQALESTGGLRFAIEGKRIIVYST